MIPIALIAVTAGLVLVRLGWARGRWIAGSGWTAAAAGLAALTVRDGAWGLAMGSVVGITAALFALAHAGWTSPARPRRAPREAPAITLPRHWPDLGRRVAVFALTVPVAFAAAQWLAFGLQAIARRGGWGETDATVLAMFLQPLGWGVIITVQMTRAHAGGMIAAPAVAALIGTLCWWAS